MEPLQHVSSSFSRLTGPEVVLVVARGVGAAQGEVPEGHHCASVALVRRHLQEARAHLYTRTTQEPRKNHTRGDLP